MLPPIKSISLDYIDDYRHGHGGRKSAKHFLKKHTRKIVRLRLKEALRKEEQPAVCSE